MADAQKRLKNARITMMAVLAVFIAVIGAALVHVLTETRPLRLENIDQVGSDLSSQEISDLEGFIWQSLQDSYGFNDDKSEIIALIRPSSFVWTENEGIKSFEFLVDIDEFKTTYQVSFSLVRGEGFYESPDIGCPVKELRKYPENCCRGKKVMEPEKAEACDD